MAKCFVFWLLCGAYLLSSAHAQSLEELQVGHWVRIKGTYVGLGEFQADSIELRNPEKYEELIGIVEETKEDVGELAVLMIMGQPVMVGNKAELFGLDPKSVTRLDGERVQIEGYWRDSGKFSARKVEVRTKSRDRIEGRIDAIIPAPNGTGRPTLQVMQWRVELPPSLELAAAEAWQPGTLAPQRLTEEFGGQVRLRDEDDEIKGYALAPGLWGGIRLEWTHTSEENFNLETPNREDRRDNEFPVRGELIWAPTDDWYGLVGYRYNWLDRRDEDNGDFHRNEGELSEAYAYLRNVLTPGLDVQVGRQDFDEQREWLYDENLDGLRLILRRFAWRFELAYASILFDGDEIEESTDTWMAIGESELSKDWRIGAYAIQRQFGLGSEYDPLHLGLRASGALVDDLEGWLEWSVLRGKEGATRLSGSAYDLGATWKPAHESPWYLTVGYAFGSGDATPSSGSDQTFRQTGLHDNNDKFGGVSSFRYYGELVDPELSNLGIWTVGVGRRLGGRNSIDLVLHQYQQDVAQTSLFDTNLDRNPDGVHTDLGTEVDLILGSRSLPGVDLEAVAGHFLPGDAFPNADSAWLFRFQVRISL